jgi:large subunit ribosomal protein L29
MLKAKDLRDQAIEELEAALLDCKKELYELQNEKKQTKKLEKPHQLRERKKDIAKILTIIGEKQRAVS